MQFFSGKLIVALCLVVAIVACSQQLVAGDGSIKEPAREEVSKKWLRFVHDGQLISIPYIDNDSKPITAARREAELNVVRTFKTLYNETAHDAFLKRRSYVMLVPHLFDCLQGMIQARCDYQLLPEDGKVPALTAQFGAAIHAMWQTIREVGEKTWAEQLDDAKIRKQKLRRSTEPEIRAIIQQINDLSDLAIAVVRASPVGLFLDWSMVFINDKHIGLWAGPIVTFCRRNGFDGILKLANAVVNYIKDIDWSGDNSPGLIDVPLMMLGSFVKCSWKQPDGSVLKMTITEIKREQKKQAKKAIKLAKSSAY